MLENFRANFLKTLAKRTPKKPQVENLGLLATPFGQALRALALNCDDLRSLWSRSNTLRSTQDFHRLATQPKSTQVERRPLTYY